MDTMLLSPVTDQLRKSSPRSMTIETKLENARKLEQAERDNKKEEKREQPNDNSDVKNPNSPIEIYRTLADHDKNAEAQYRLAELLLLEENWHDGFYYMKLSAEQKHQTAQCRLAELYLHGIGIDQDHACAILWFQASEDNTPDHSFPRAQLHLGVMRCMGYGTKRDFLAGSAHLLQAERSYDSTDTQFGEDIGHIAFYLKPAKVLPTAVFQLSKKYLARKDNEKYQIYLNKSAEHDHPVAQFLKTNNADQILIANLKTYAEKGCIDSAFMLGNFYKNENDVDTAIYYFKLAAQSGCSNAAFALADLYVSNNQHDLAEPLLLQTFNGTQDAVLKMNAAYSLYELYEHLHTSKAAWGYFIDYHAKATEYCKIAAQLGHPIAKKIIREISRPKLLSVSDSITIPERKTSGGKSNTQSKSAPDYELTNFVDGKK